jgi:cytochrome c
MNRKTFTFARAATLIAPSLMGAALLSTASALPAAGPVPDGALLFQQRCAACHTVAPGGRAGLAPSLSGLVGRKAASTQFNYSPALKASKLTWTRANLDRYLTGPGQMVPGTRMVISISDPAQRAAILNFLARPSR